MIDESFAGSARPLLDGPSAPRIKLFAAKYFPHYCDYPPSRFHKELSAELGRILDAPEGQLTAIAAPRGHAKSTWVSLFLVLYCLAYELKWFIVIISEVSSVANQLLTDVKAELEENVGLARDFPHLVGIGPEWREDTIITNNGRRVLALGTGKRIRGRRFRQYRPDLWVIDDLENDDHVRSREQREKVHNWLLKAVLKSKGVGRKADALVIGTILHFDSVLARLLDVRKSPGWRRFMYKAIIRFSNRADLWEHWRNLYTDWLKTDDERMADAQAFYDKHEKAMLDGTEVLWPEGEDYLTCQKMILNEGQSAFDSEKQNVPINPELCEFQEDWFRWFEEVPDKVGVMWFVPASADGTLDWSAAIRTADCDFYGGVDPSMGKMNRGSDPSAIISVGAYPAARLDNEKKGYRLFFVADAEIKKVHPHLITERLLELHALRRYERVGIETIQFQELFAEHVQEAALEDEMSLNFDGIYVKGIKPITDKVLRIQKLGRFIFSGRMLFSRKLTTLYQQLRYFPQADHDDGPDALEMTMRTIKESGWIMLTMDSREEYQGKMHIPKKKAYDFQLRMGMAELFAGADGTCAACNNFAPPIDPSRPGRCKARNELTMAKNPACDEFTAVPEGLTDAERRDESGEELKLEDIV